MFCIFPKEKKARSHSEQFNCLSFSSSPFFSFSRADCDRGISAQQAVESIHHCENVVDVLAAGGVGKSSSFVSLYVLFALLLLLLLFVAA